MPFVRKLRKRLRRDSTAHLYPRKRDAEPLRVQRMEKFIREKSIISKQFHVKYVGRTLIVSPTLSPTKQVELALKIVRKGPRTNKRRVTLFFTPEKVFVNDAIYRCGLDNYHMDEVGSVFALPHDWRLVGIIVKDTDTSGYSYFLFRCSWKGYKYENVEVKEQFENMYEEYLKIKDTLKHEQSQDYLDFEDPPYYERLRNFHGVDEYDELILNKSLYKRIEKPANLTIHRSRSDTQISSAERPVRRTIMAQLRQCAQSSDKVGRKLSFCGAEKRKMEQRRVRFLSQPSQESAVSLTQPSSVSLTQASQESAVSLTQPSQKSAVSLTQPRSVPLAVLPTLKIPFPPKTPPNLPPSCRIHFAPCFTRTVKLAFYFMSTATTIPLFSISGIKLRFSPCSLILSPSRNTATPSLNSPSTSLNSNTSTAPSTALSTTTCSPVTAAADSTTATSTADSANDYSTVTSTTATANPLTLQTVVATLSTSMAKEGSPPNSPIPSSSSSSSVSSSVYSSTITPSICSSCSSDTLTTVDTHYQFRSLPALSHTPPPPPSSYLNYHHSYPLLGRTVAPSPLLEGILSSLFIYNRHSPLCNEGLRGRVEDYELVPVQSSWISAARLTFLDEEPETPRRKHNVQPDIQKIVDRLEKRERVKRHIHPRIQEVVDILEKK